VSRGRIHRHRHSHRPLVRHLTEFGCGSYPPCGAPVTCVNAPVCASARRSCSVRF
jgi:hypothetical protein